MNIVSPLDICVVADNSIEVQCRFSSMTFTSIHVSSVDSANWRLVRILYDICTLMTEWAEIHENRWPCNHGTRTRRAIFHVAPGGSVPTLVNDSADILRVRTPSMNMPIYYDYYPVIADTPTTPVTSRFRLRLLFNVIRVVGGIWNISMKRKPLDPLQS